jgi:hypothetical protein
VQENRQTVDAAQQEAGTGTSCKMVKPPQK